MIYCTRCLQPNTRPNTKFSQGICPACAYHLSLANIDWSERHRILVELVRERAPTHGEGFDCILGVSGGKDSLRQALFLRDKLGINPLLACLTYPPQQLTERGAQNLSNLINHGFDVQVVAPKPATWCRFMRAGFSEFANWAKSTELALFSAVPQMAIDHGIQLIMWGENPGLQLGDLKTLGRTGYDGNNLRFMNTLAGGGANWLEPVAASLDDLIPYQYPSAEVFEQHGLQIVYLGWFMRDWSLRTNAAYSVTSGLELRVDVPSETGDLLGATSLDEDWVTLNQMIKYYKFGFGRATDYVNEAIRNSEISRDEAIELVAKYDGCCGDQYIATFAQYIDITVEQFWDRVIEVVNRDLFIVGDRKITPRFAVGVGLP